MTLQQERDQLGDQLARLFLESGGDVRSFRERFAADKSLSQRASRLLGSIRRKVMAPIGHLHKDVGSRR